MLLSLAAFLFVRPIAPAEVEGMGIELRGEFMTVAYGGHKTPKVMFPLPRDYRGQVPLRFDLKVKPASALVSGRVVEGECGDRVAELLLKPMKDGAKVNVAWRSLVFADSGERERMKLP
ncbi:hypothetical protein EON79_21750, partial [bacterium]